MDREQLFQRHPHAVDVRSYLSSQGIPEERIAFVESWSGLDLSRVYVIGEATGVGLNQGEEGHCVYVKIDEDSSTPGKYAIGLREMNSGPWYTWEELHSGSN